MADIAGVTNRNFPCVEAKFLLHCVYVVVAVFVFVFFRAELISKLCVAEGFLKAFLAFPSHKRKNSEIWLKWRSDFRLTDKVESHFTKIVIVLIAVVWHS